ncbi:glutamate--tRNA ligase [Candidatus Woesearchaeota archaeon]|nr:glutamate--tRNA ligase [Candidatus Woesearchaeota archaeon]
MDDLDIKKEIRNFSLHNAVKFNGKASSGAVIGRLVGKHPDIKARLNEYGRIISDIIKEVNAMDPDAQMKELEENAPELLEEKKEVKKKDLPELKLIKDEVVMRFEPSPSGPLHIGHLYPLALNLEYVRRYKGIFYLRIADTNADNIDPGSYSLIPENAGWFAKREIKPVIQSDRMELYYNYALKLIEEGYMYVCGCTADEFKELKAKKSECPCRNLKVGEQVKRWHRMFDREKGYQEGEAVVRFKTDMKHKNPAMRDFPMIRINDSEHARQGSRYRVWPLMNFSVAIDDMDMAVTHTLRGKDHADNAKKQAMIHHALGYPTPYAISVGRINFLGFPVSCSQTKAGIKEGMYEGWDDVRIPFVPALKRRGYRPEAFIRYALDVGVSANDKSVDIKDFFKTIDCFNKEVLDPVSQRFFFVRDPVGIDISGSPDQEVELDLHPEHRKGGRKFMTSSSFWVEQRDFEKFREGSLYRLMDCLNFRRSGDSFRFVSADYRDFKDNGDMIIHWLPQDETVDVEVLMPDNTVASGFGERGIVGLDVGDIIQFERFGFCRLENASGKYFFVFCHR